MTNQLPPHFSLSIASFTASFNNVTNAYKHYWLLGLLDQIQHGNSDPIPIKTLLVSMIAQAWYPARYFKLSFGKQDKLAEAALAIDEQAVPNPAKGYSIIATLLAERPLSKGMRRLGRYVPYRFLRPFFAEETRGLKDSAVNKRLAALANDAFASGTPPLYRFVENESKIELHSLWFAYLRQYLSIVRDFCYWHLLRYMQKNNPSVPNLPEKLFAPQARDLKLARRFWKVILDQNTSLSCIYSGQPITSENISLDHFVPWRYVTHDLLWNIVPTPKAVNSSKGDRLPDFESYFPPFSQMQYGAFQTVWEANKKNLLEDYGLLFQKASLEKVQALPFDLFQETLHDQLNQLFLGARNLGYETGWRYVSPD